MARQSFIAVALFATVAATACGNDPVAPTPDTSILVPDVASDTSTADVLAPTDLSAPDGTADTGPLPDMSADDAVIAPETTDASEFPDTSPPPEPHLAQPLVDNESDLVDDDAPLDGVPFTSSAYVSARPCSRRSYTTLDNCYNEVHPPAPSIRRSLVRADFAPANDTLPFGQRVDPAANHTNKVQALPSQRTTVDGRLSIAGGCDGCEALQFRLLRPENVGYDLTVADTDHLVQDIRNDPWSWIGTPQSRFMLWNPADSALTAHATDASGRLALPDVLQSTLCEATSDRVTSVILNGAPLAETLPANPRRCRARFGETDALEDGDCYDLSVLVGATTSVNGTRWEFRSSALTVFVRQPKRLSTGRTGFQEGASAAVWPYPRNPSGLSTESGIDTLPPFSRFEIARAFYRNTNGSKILACPDANGQDLTGANWWECFNYDKRPDATRFMAQIRGPNGHCFDASGNPKAGAPGFCEYFFNQHRAETLYVDDDEDAIVGNGRPWNGRTSNCGNDPACRPGFAMFESITTADGMLLVLNLRGVFYAYNTIAPCRADGFAQMKPISWLPGDPAVNTRYDIARITGGRPFRDPNGDAIPFGVNNTGAYPWIDRRGRNLFYAAQNLARDGWVAERADFQGYAGQATGSIVGTGQPPTDNTRRQQLNPDHGPGTQYAILGSWTHGKAVLVDEINGADFGGGDAIGTMPADSVGPRTRYQVRLYSGPDGIVDFQSKGVQSVTSFEHILGYYDALRPILPFDVVWTMQTDIQRNVEIAFDPWLNRRALVVGHMNAPLDMRSSPVDADVRPRPSAFVQDGFAPSGWSGAMVRYGDTADFRFRNTPRIQNAATTDPNTGLLAGQTMLLRGGARIEPVGMGGVLGKGVYLDGWNDFIDMPIPSQSGIHEYAASLWLDLRDDGLGVRPRTILHFPDGSFIGLRSPASGRYEFVFFSSADGKLRALPATGLVQVGRWFHFGIAVRGGPNDRRMDVRVDGTFLGTLTFDASTDGGRGFQLVVAESGSAARTRIGDPGPAFAGTSGIKRRTWKGWVDEVRISVVPAAEQLDPSFSELACNDALGTLVDTSVRPSETAHPALDALRMKRAGYPAGPLAVCEQLQLYPSSDESLQAAMIPRQRERGLCIDRVHATQRPQADLAERCLRTPRLALPKMTWDAPRPDDSANTFCLTCHYAPVGVEGLGLEALGVIPNVPRWQDPRRQPLHVPARIGGHLPQALLPPALGLGAPLDAWFDHHAFLPPLTE